MKSTSLPSILREFRCGATTVLYVRDLAGDKLGLWLVPTKLRRKIVARRNCLGGVELENLPPPAEGAGFPAWGIESLMQVKVLGDEQAPGFSPGRTLRNSPTVDKLKFTWQKVRQQKGGLRVRTTFKHADGGWLAHHDLGWRKGASWLDSSVTIENTSRSPITLEMLASFSLGGVSPFATDDAPGRLQLHRFRGVWSMEGRLVTQAFEDLQLEPSWVGYGVRCERFGAVGSLPTNGFFPCAAIEDTGVGVTWGAQLAHPGSWQMEVYRRDDLAAFSGGLADREFGHWMKNLSAGKSFTSPPAMLACVQGGLDDCCVALTAAQEVPLTTLPKCEADLPVMFNEWTSSWGDPSDANMKALAASLRGTGIKYLVMDAGWFKRDGGNWFSGQGDWIPNAAMYPEGIRATADAIRAQGMLPGLWFEMEVVGSASTLWDRTDLLLHRDGRPLTVGSRRFLDLRKPEVGDHLAGKVIATLKAGNFGYLKVDYNENIGLGPDGAESLGEGLRQHLDGVVAFFKRLRAEIPDLVIENCSSGGHRLEPTMMGLTAMSSFSDAHECREIPIIAANLHLLMLPRQSQIWAVLRAKADLRRTLYLLAGGFLGRLCLSGDFATLRPAQRALVAQAIALYKKSVPIIRRGRSYRHGPEVLAYRHAEGWQAVVRVGTTGKQALVVAHTFAKPGQTTVRVPLPTGKWKVADTLMEKSGGVTLAQGKLRWQPKGEWAAAVVLLTR
ncbi:MAG: alpha-galactosidase [Cephaloticoccus sp.]|nr:alpha-galactosidase [Cephaloticoccus sp.]MCF7761063.1 alpha-galactosidase [Cephaloticoccus sp.]